MSGTPSISVDSSGNSYVSIGVTDTSNNRVNITTVKRLTDGTLAWTKTNTVITSTTGESASNVTSSNLYHYLHDNPDEVTSVSHSQGPLNIDITFTLPEAISFAGFRNPLPSADYIKITANSVSRSLALAGGINDVSGGIRLRSDQGTDAIIGGIATFYLGGTSVVTGTFNLDVWFEGIGGATLTKNKATLSGLSFAEYGAPSAPRSLGATFSAKALNLSWSAPEYADLSNNKLVGEVGAPIISSYKIAPSVVSSSRYPSATYSAGTKTSSTTSYNLTGLYPATTYSVAVSAVNSGSKEGAATTDQFTTSAPTVVPKYLNSAGTTFLTSDFTGTLYAIGNASSLTVPVLRVSGGSWSTTLATRVGVHHAGNIGSSSSSIMSFSAEIDSSSCAVSFDGFGSATPAKSTTGGGFQLSGTPADVSAGVDSGYFLQVAPTIAYQSTTGISTNKNLILKQTLASGGGTPSVTIPIQWDVLAAGVYPSLSASNITVTPNSSALKQICGVKYFGSTYGFTFGASSIGGMGSHHYRANPITLTVADASSTLTSLTSLTTFSGQTVSKTGTYTYYGPGDYTASVALTNLNGLTTTTSYSGSLPVIDPFGVWLWEAITPASVPVLSQSLSYGKRISSFAFTFPEAGLTAFPDNSINLTTGAGTREAMVAKGYCCCPGYTGAYRNYSGTDSNKDYSGITDGSGGITASGYRYATFQWIGQRANPRTYGYLKLVIETDGNTSLVTDDNVTNTNSSTQSKKLYNGSNLVDIYYSITYEDGNISWSGWIDANSLSNNDNFKNITFLNTPVPNGASGGQATGTKENVVIDPSASGNTYTYHVNLPTVSATSESSILVAIGGKSVESNGLAFKVQAAYVAF